LKESYFFRPINNYPLPEDFNKRGVLFSSKELQTVEVFLYLMTFTKAHKGKITPRPLTSDEVLTETCEQLHRLALKSTSVPSNNIKCTIYDETEKIKSLEDVRK
jgi:hypothetical protein